MDCYKCLLKYPIYSLFEIIHPGKHQNEEEHIMGTLEKRQQLHKKHVINVRILYKVRQYHLVLTL